MVYTITYSLKKKGKRRLAKRNEKILFLKSKLKAKKIVKEYAGLNPRIKKVKVK